MFIEKLNRSTMGTEREDFNLLVLGREIMKAPEYFNDEEDEDVIVRILVTREKNRIPRIEGYVEHIVPTFQAKEFQSHFRMWPTTFELVLQEIGAKLSRPSLDGNPMINPCTQLLLTLWRMATPDSVQQGFFRTSAFPSIIGAIDGTHINIPAPRENPESYVNRKGHHSIQVQAICDHSRLFTHLYVGNVGSVHDARVFRLSEVYTFMGRNDKFPDNSHLVGDGAYAIHENLMVPYVDNGHLTALQKNFNFCLSSARIVVERAFALLKGRWRSLLRNLAMSRVEDIPYFVLACCVLHNICLLEGDEVEAALLENDEVVLSRRPADAHQRVVALGKRHQIAATLRMRDV